MGSATPLPPFVPAALDRMSDAADYAVVGPHDGRRPVLNTRAFPYAAICHVERDFGDGRWSGCTGFMIAPHIIVTAGHCTVSIVRRLLLGKGAPARIRVTPGRFATRGGAPFGRYRGVRWFTHRRFLGRGRRPFDVGVVILDRPATSVGQVFPLWSPGDAELARVRQSRLLHISGYPGDKPRGTQWEHEERLDRVETRQLFYSIDTCPGHSGAPVWVEAARGAPAVVAIHVAGPPPHQRGAWGCKPGAPVAPAGAVNRGVRLTPDLMRALSDVGAGRANEDMIEMPAAM